MEKVIPADREAVAVTGHHDDGELRSGELDARREGERTTVGRMDRAAVDVADDPAGATDASHEDHVVQVLEPLRQHPEQGAHHDAVTAARAQHVGHGLFP